tara:strand:- start:1077 stop:1907 length:831 start_codon:yes stop_codon:yes gene_type:complete
MSTQLGDLTYKAMIPMESIPNPFEGVAGMSNLEVNPYASFSSINPGKLQLIEELPGRQIRNRNNFGSFFTDNPEIGKNAVEGAASGVGGIVQFLAGKKRAKRNTQRTERAFRAEVQNLRNVDVSNPFARISNPYANLTVNQQQARFQAEQGQQALTDILAQQSAAAGGSGIAALAQAMANQRTGQIQQASASIGQQESANAQLRAQGEAQRQMAIARGEQVAQDQRATKASVLTDLAAKEFQAAQEYEQQLDKALGQGISGLAQMGTSFGLAAMQK